METPILENVLSGGEMREELGDRNLVLDNYTRCDSCLKYTGICMLCPHRILLNIKNIPPASMFMAGHKTTHTPQMHIVKESPGSISYQEIP